MVKFSFPDYLFFLICLQRLDIYIKKVKQVYLFHSLDFFSKYLKVLVIPFAWIMQPFDVSIQPCINYLLTANERQIRGLKNTQKRKG